MPNLHPIIVHFPVALIIIVAVSDLIGILTGRKSFTQTATIVSVFAALGAIGAVITGLLAEDSVWHPEAAHEMLETHETVGLVFLGLVVIIAVFRLAIGNKIYDRFRWIGFVLALIACGVVAYGAYLGGEMVYTYGAGVKAAQTATANADSLKIELNSLKAIESQDQQKNEIEEEHEHHHH